MGQDGKGEERGVLCGVECPACVRPVGQGGGPDSGANLACRHEAEKKSLIAQNIWLQGEVARLKSMLLNVWGDC